MRYIILYCYICEPVIAGVDKFHKTGAESRSRSTFHGDPPEIFAGAARRRRSANSRGGVKPGMLMPCREGLPGEVVAFPPEVSGGSVPMAPSHPGGGMGPSSCILAPPAGMCRNILQYPRSSRRMILTGRSSADSPSVFAANALRTASVSVVSRFRWFLFFDFLFRVYPRTQST